jgi:hypothetical protein
MKVPAASFLSPFKSRFHFLTILGITLVFASYRTITAYLNMSGAKNGAAEYSTSNHETAAHNQPSSEHENRDPSGFEKNGRKNLPLSDSQLQQHPRKAAGEPSVDTSYSDAFIDDVMNTSKRTTQAPPPKRSSDLDDIEKAMGLQ